MKSGSYPVVEQGTGSCRVWSIVKDKELTDPCRHETFVFVIPCDRCLEDVRHEFVLDSTKHVDLGLSDAELTEELDESNFIDGYHLDVDKLLFNEILSGWPTKVLCREDCKGTVQRMRSEPEYGVPVTVKIRDLILECQLSVTYLRILRRCNLCQSVQRINLQRQEEIREEPTGR